MTSRIRSAYRAIERITGTEYLEPLGDVEQVEAWRQSYRPKTVKLLIVAESHVRQKNGPGFIYDVGYHTPWWQTLLWPAFHRGSCRQDDLDTLRDRGVWILDASAIALSGYRNVQPEWPKRPFDAHRLAILQATWECSLREEFLAAAKAPVIYFERAGELLPEPTRRKGTPLRFFGPSNAKRYRDPAYRYGTACFLEAVQAARL